MTRSKDRGVAARERRREAALHPFRQPHQDLPTHPFEPQPGEPRPVAAEPRPAQEKPNVLARRFADGNHDVLTVKTENARPRYTPCETCPWLRENVGEFPAEAFRLAAHTCAIPEALSRSPGGDDHDTRRMFNAFACHTSGPDKPSICAGYIASGDGALSWRVSVVVGKFDPSKVSEGEHDFFDDYKEMAIANGVAEDDPALACLTASLKEGEQG